MMMPIANTDTITKNQSAHRRVSVGEEPERSAGIAHVGEVKETRDDLVTIGVAEEDAR